MKKAAAKVVKKPETSRKKAIAKDVSSSKKISSFFTKKSPESTSNTNRTHVTDLNQKTDSNNKRKILESEENGSLEHNLKLRKIESHSAITSKTPPKVSKYAKDKEKSKSYSKKRKIDKTSGLGTPNDSKISRSFSNNILTQVSPLEKSNKSPKDSHVNSSFLDSDLVSKSVLKENVVSDEDSAVASEFSSLENNVNEMGKLKCISKGLNKENSLDVKISNVSDKKIEVDVNSEDFCLSDFGDEFDQLLDDNWDEITESKLDLSVLKRCDVLDVVRSARDFILALKDSNSEKKASVKCCDYWCDAKVEKGQVVTVQATKINGEWIVSNSSGFLITQPDLLISGTTVVGALFCNRRSIIQEKFRGIDALPQVQSDRPYLTTGLLVHNILQKTLELKIETLAEIQKIYEEIIESFESISLMHQCGMSIQDCRTHVEPYIPQIYNFIQTYMKGKNQSTSKNFEGQIETIRDIEENIWLPKLGLKGKIDVSVEVKIHSRRKIMPLELKTGKSSFSPEHKGQVILYTMMMSLIGQQVDSGLLLYLKENVMKEIKNSHHEQRDLLMLRNTLSYYLAKKSNVNVDNFEDFKELMLDLPEPINHRNACSSCPVNNLCCMYLSHDENFRQKDSSHPLKVLSEKILSRLKPEHINYVMRWVKLLQIEEDSNSANSMKDMWTLEPRQREKKGSCICNLKLVSFEEQEGQYSHTFKKNEEDRLGAFSISEINVGDYIVINTNERINISTGYVADIKDDSISVLLDRNLIKNYKDQVFHVDKYFSSSISNYNRAAVSGLLGEDEVCSRLRSIVIEKKPATFEPRLHKSISSISAPILKRLNSQQQRAIFKILTSREYALLKGMPGTGKTRTIVALVELLVKLGKSVLVTANTHSAVDNILIGLMERNIDFLRLGSQAKIHPSLVSYSEDVVTSQCKTPESLQEVYAGKKVVGVTCLGAYHQLFQSRKFDMCLVDESTQVQQCAVLKPLYNATKFLLVGDPEQLPPIARSEKARKLGFNESLFSRLDSENNTIVLSAQYRMNREIMNLANKVTYNDQLEAGSEEIANALLPLKNIELLESFDWWLRASLSLKLEESVILLNTSIPTSLNLDSESVKKGSKINTSRLEAGIVQRLVNTLLKIGLDKEDIGVIAPFRAQVSLLGNSLPQDVEVNTVDQYQGREKNIIVYSCTESSPQGSTNTRAFHILDDHKRLTVAMTRAKHKLVIIGDKKILETYSPFEKLLRFMRQENIIDLFDPKKSFDWKELVDSLNKSQS
ncbi:DNA replication ATP-dependent helicase/nuclease DNA2 [Belonocnema kinseyi]|uniref:DNA replication ATP-dependent helicase/nuclease DNA2 n=1 Tax=Belonocnema kinseyi TaxID=2817044 RepID=UPI00143DF43D|nr:DNA replication ATP-dependent helicase/nuclease DNA2 [Belonocnema kinseyi]